MESDSEVEDLMIFCYWKKERPRNEEKENVRDITKTVQFVVIIYHYYHALVKDTVRSLSVVSNNPEFLQN